MNQLSGYTMFLISLLFAGICGAQPASISGKVSSQSEAVAYAIISLVGTGIGSVSDESGYYKIMGVPSGQYKVKVSCTGYEDHYARVVINDSMPVVLDVALNQNIHALDDLVVTGSIKEMSRTESAIAVEVITPKYFQKNPVSSIFEAIGMINGVHPQLNCNVCNTGDIHINGMEGPYTMVLIDGMPIVSALSTVYGLNGIPASLVERVEVVKGPASTLYGSEAMGGVINLITKDPAKAPAFNTDILLTSYGELNADISTAKRFKKTHLLLGLNYFNFQVPWDKNNDGFTDITLQNRVSVFNKVNFVRKENRLASIAVRYVHERRWGGEMDWDWRWRGSDSIYGESIITHRAELIAAYQLPVKEKIMSQLSYNWHDQDAYYGQTSFDGRQQVLFAQMFWDKFIRGHDILIGSSFRYTFYDDNTPATASADSLSNTPAHTVLPGIFIQDEWTINKSHKLLAGYRYDYDKNHGSVHSPRLAYRYAPNVNHIIRTSFGTGYRVVNLFTEDHAALTGAREVVIADKLLPERSYNVNVNYHCRIPSEKVFLSFDLNGFFTYFTNKITGDFDFDPNKIIYDNLDGHAVSAGVSLNAEITLSIPLKIYGGVTVMDVHEKSPETGNQKSRQLFAPVWSGNFAISYTFPKNYILDLTGIWNGAMRLPVFPNDPRPEYSPVYCIANIQATKKFRNGVELYGGLKNLFNFMPKDPIMRAFDPFDKTVDDPETNPYGHTFDPTYNYAPLQGIRFFAGVRYNLFK